jgi:PAS domain S-box-containing protein
MVMPQEGMLEMPDRTAINISNIALFPEENPSPVLRVDGSGVLLYANRAATDLLAQWQCDIGGSVPDFILKKLSMTLESGQNQELEVRYGNLDFSFAMVAIVERGYVNFYGRDVTQSKQVEAELARSEESLKRAQEIANLGSWELDLTANSLHWSDETYRLFGLQPKEFGASYEAFLEAVHPDDRAAVNEAYTSSINDGRDSYEIEHRVVQRGAGKILYVHEKCEHIRDASGKIVGSVGMVHDITARKQKQMEIEHLNAELEARARDLEDLNRELEAFNYMIAHDLSKPLTVISSYCQILEELLGDKLDHQSLDYLTQITNSTFNMSELINALLDFSRLAHTEPKLEDVNLSDVAKAVITELRIAELEREVTFRVAENLTARVDMVLIKAVLANLFGNAWKFTAHQKEAVIEFGMSERDGKNAFFIRDNGIGFSMAEAQNLFEPFHRLRGAEATSGFGIGLAIVERIIRRHGGEIWAEGAPLQGAIFYFSV